MWAIFKKDSIKFLLPCTIRQWRVALKVPIPECGGRYTTFLERYSRPLFRQFRMMKMRVFHTKYFLWISLLLTIYSQVPNKRSSPRLLESRQKSAPPPHFITPPPPFNIFSDFCNRPHCNLPTNRPHPRTLFGPPPPIIKILKFLWPSPFIWDLRVLFYCLYYKTTVV